MQNAPFMVFKDWDLVICFAMISSMRHTTPLLLIFSLCSAVIPNIQERRPRMPSTEGQKDQRRFVLASNGFNVEANGAGNAPFFSYWPDGSNRKMKVMFEKMWQVDDLERPVRRINTISLIGMYDWAFTDATSIELNGGQVVDTAFNMTGIPKQQQQQLPIISFLNHFLSSVNGTELKFDVDISGFQVIFLLLS